MCLVVMESWEVGRANVSFFWFVPPSLLEFRLEIWKDRSFLDWFCSQTVGHLSQVHLLVLEFPDTNGNKWSFPIFAWNWVGWSYRAETTGISYVPISTIKQQHEHTPTGWVLNHPWNCKDTFELQHFSYNDCIISTHPPLYGAVGVDKGAVACMWRLQGSVHNLY